MNEHWVNLNLRCLCQWFLYFYISNKYNILGDIRDHRLIDNITNLSKIGTSTRAEACSVKAYADYHDFSNILREFPTITVPQGYTPREIHTTSYYIETNGPPIYGKPRQLTLKKLIVAKKQF